MLSSKASSPCFNTCCLGIPFSVTGLWFRAPAFSDLAGFSVPSDLARGRSPCFLKYFARKLLIYCIEKDCNICIDNIGTSLHHLGFFQLLGQGGDKLPTWRKSPVDFIIPNLSRKPCVRTACSHSLTQPIALTSSTVVRLGGCRRHHKNGLKNEPLGGGIPCQGSFCCGFASRSTPA